MRDQDTKINIEKVIHYLTLAKSLKGSCYYYDMHTHPFEIVFTKGTYHKNHHQAGVYSTGSNLFIAPQLKEIVIEHQDDKAAVPGTPLRPAIFRMKFSALYAHTGPGVFIKQMNLSTVDRILLLPMASAEGTINTQMNDMKKIFKDDERFFRAWSVSNDIENEDILKEACDAIKSYNICAIKQNLTQTETNISHKKGRERLEAILNSCSKLNLPLILHSGRSPLAESRELSRYGEIELLAGFDWSSYTCPIVFAHSAAYGYSASEIRDYIIPQLKKILYNQPNIFIDISGVDITGLKYILDEISASRILFGSDALYEPQWQRVVKLLYALAESSQNTEMSFRKIMSKNAEKYIFKNSAIDI